MAVVEHQVTISRDPAYVYRVSQDYDIRFDWDPFLEKLEVVRGSADDPQIGTQVAVRSRLGMKMVVEFVQIDPPERVAVKMVSAPGLIAKFAGSWNFRPIGEATEVTFRYVFTMGPFARLTTPIAIAYFRRVVRKRLAALKSYCERQELPAS
ncbi:MAG: type II toxin-antitoxin system RatA family toxin [Fimbriimonas sp.]